MKHALRFLTLFVIAALAAAFLAAPALAAPAPAPAPSERILPAILASVDTEDLMPDMEPLLEQSELPESNSRGGDSDWTKVLYGDGYRLIKYKGEETEIVVPSEIDGKPVVSLYQTFWGNETVVSVTLPDTVTEIGYYAFYGCTALQEVTLSDGVTTIGYQAFSGCTALQEVTLPVSVTKLDYGAFSGCTTLASVTGGAITSLGIYAFNNCSALTEAPTFPDGLTEIPYGAFFGCSSLTSVTGGALTSLGELAFCECDALTEGPTLAEGLTSIPQAAFYGCEALQELTIPCSVQTIGEAAVYGCAALTEIELPDGLTTIGEHAFNWCTGLAEVDVPDSVTEIGAAAFYPTTTLIVGEGSCAQRWAAANGYSCQVRGGVDLTQEIAPDATTVSEKADAIVAALVTEDMSDYEKALILHDYLILHADYDHTYTCYTAADILLHGSGVCQAYTLAYEELLDRAGIENDTETGYDHIWNMAKLDGEWVHIDCTWDDPSNENDPDAHYENHEFFGITNYALEGIRSHECYNKPHIATSVERSYAWMTGVLPENIGELEDTLVELIAAGEFHGAVSSVFGGSTRSISAAGDGEGILGRMIYQGAVSENSSLCINKLLRLFWKLSNPARQYPVKLTNTSYDSQTRTMRYDAYAFVPDIDTLILPHDLTALEAESFVGSPTDRVILPDALESVGEDAFKNVYAVLEAPEDSFALDYAMNSGLPWQVRPAEEELTG